MVWPTAAPTLQVFSLMSMCAAHSRTSSPGPRSGEQLQVHQDPHGSRQVTADTANIAPGYRSDLLRFLTTLAALEIVDGVEATVDSFITHLHGCGPFEGPANPANAIVDRATRDLVPGNDPIAYDPQAFGAE